MFTQIQNPVNNNQNATEEEYEIIEYDIDRYSSKDLSPSNINFVLPGKKSQSFSQYLQSHQHDTRLYPESCICNLKNYQSSLNLIRNNFSNPACTCNNVQKFHTKSQKNFFNNNYNINPNICPLCRHKIKFANRSRYSDEPNNNNNNQILRQMNMQRLRMEDKNFIQNQSFPINRLRNQNIPQNQGNVPFYPYQNPQIPYLNPNSSH